MNQVTTFVFSASVSVASLASPSNGISPTAQWIDNESNEAIDRLRSTSAFGLERILTELSELLDESHADGWDDETAPSISSDSVRATKRLLRTLRDGEMPTSVGTDPDGEITLEWYRSPRRVVSVSVSADGMLSYAAVFGRSRSHGEEMFVGEFPDRIRELVRDVA